MCQCEPLVPWYISGDAQLQWGLSSLLPVVALFQWKRCWLLFAVLHKGFLDCSIVPCPVDMQFRKHYRCGFQPGPFYEVCYMKTWYGDMYGPRCLAEHIHGIHTKYVSQGKSVGDKRCRPDEI